MKHKRCQLCGSQWAPYVSTGAEVGDAYLCQGCTEHAMGRAVQAWEWSERARAWAEGRPQVDESSSQETMMMPDAKRLC